MRIIIIRKSGLITIINKFGFKKLSSSPARISPHAMKSRPRVELIDKILDLFLSRINLLNSD